MEVRMEAGRIGGCECVRDAAAKGALPLVGTARAGLSRLNKASCKEQADVRVNRLPLLGKQELKPAAANGNYIA